MIVIDANALIAILLGLLCGKILWEFGRHFVKKIEEWWMTR